ncbi:MAG: ABC transporter permease [Clostridia bacterium]|nr:ABC transporter permease [Clostridia bacterium]
MDMKQNRISWFGQVGVYLGKCFRLFVNEKQWKNFITSAVLMFIILIVTGNDMFKVYKDTKNGVFTIICGCVWIGLFNSIQSICRERAIIKREYRTGLRLSAYITAHAAYEAFLCAVESLIVTVMMYIAYGSEITGESLIIAPPIDFYLTFFLVVFGSDAIAIFVSSLVRKENTAMTIMPFVLIVQLVMSGAIFPLEDATDVISYGTFSRWGINGAMRIANMDDALKADYQRAFQAGIEKMNMDPEAGELWKVWGVMLLIALIFLVGSALILRLVDKDKRI